MPSTAPRVIVTRPEREAAQWVAELTARGLAATALPLIAIGPCTDPSAQQAMAAARQRLAHGPGYRALMFVSSNAALHFLHGAPPLPAGTRAWAPGPGTARALEQLGVPPAAIDGPAADAPQFDSESLWQQVGAQVRPGDRVLIVRGRSAGVHESSEGSGRDWLAHQVQAAGGQVDWAVAYERAAPRFTPDQAALAEAALQDGSLWLLSSSEAVAHLAEALPGRSFAPARALATHPRIAQTARAMGFGHVRECRPALEDVVASIESAP